MYLVIDSSTSGYLVGGFVHRNFVYNQNPIKMNKVIKSIITFLTLSGVLFLIAPLSLAATSGDGEIGEPIIIDPEIMEGGCHTRTLVVVPIEAYYYSSQNLVQITLCCQIDNLTVRLTNLSTLQTSVYDVSPTGTTNLLILYGTGPYSIEFFVDGALHYTGYFISH